MIAPEAPRLGTRVDVAAVRKSYGSVRAIERVDLALSPASFTALLGPSGCGKSTLLALLAGLEHPDAGDIRLDDRSVQHLPAEDRPVGLVFQKPLLFPHLNVLDNVAFGLRMQRRPRRGARARARDLLEQVGLADLAPRRVGELSGGQEQRVALARALVLRPRLLLLDEPFSQLDPDLRARMRQLVRTLSAEAKLTTLFVTHDLAEAVDVADEIVLMLDGRVEGQGSPERFYQDPPTLEAARFFEVANELAGHCERGMFHAPGLVAPLRVHQQGIEGPAVLVVRPESMRLGSIRDEPAGISSGASETDGLIVRAYPLGVRFAGTHLILEACTDDGLRVLAHLPPGTTVADQGSVQLRAAAESCTLFPSSSA